MCGIAGLLSLDGAPVGAAEVRRMCDALRHRGPDDEGYHEAPGVVLGMRRLSIIDVDGGHQPIANEDGTVHVVLNGEIYNFRGLRSGLEARGHRFRTASDTEVIVHLYEERGPACVDDLRGMFAFALWDAARRRLLLARDRLGVKPLYYAQAGGRLAFASELKALLTLPEVGRDLDWRSVARLFTFLTTPLSHSVVAGVRKLPPATLMVAGPGRPPLTSSYWDVRFEPVRGREPDDLAEELRHRIEEAVRLRLVSDVPVGAFLSGGVDSSAVVTTMTGLTPSRVKTFTIGFRDAAYDESAVARRLARRLGTEHHELVVEPDAIGALETIVWHLDEPFGDPSAIPTFLVAKLAAGYVKVVLSGDGGDELFAGYDKYRVEAARRGFAIPGPLRRPLRALARALPDGARGRGRLFNLSQAPGDRSLDASTLFRTHELRRLFRPEAFARMAAFDPWAEEAAILQGTGGHWLSAMQRLDLKSYLPLDILTKVDRMSMAHSLEAREPLLDHPLVEFAATLPPELLLRAGQPKWILKRAFRGIVPDEVLDRPKSGFAVPVGRWFRGDLTGFVRDVLLSRACRERGILDPRQVERLMRRHERGRPLDLHLYTLLGFELWCRLFLDRGAARHAPEALCG